MIAIEPITAKIGSQLIHKTFGMGEGIEIAGDKMTVTFIIDGKKSEKKFKIPNVLGNGLFRTTQ